MIDILKLRNENDTLKTTLKAYERMCKAKDTEIEMLNASLDATVADRDRWKKIAYALDAKKAELLERVKHD